MCRVLENKDIKKQEKLKKQFDNSFSKFVEFMFFKRIVYDEPSYQSPIHVKLRQIIDLWNDKINEDSEDEEIKEGENPKLTSANQDKEK